MEEMRDGRGEGRKGGTKQKRERRVIRRKEGKEKDRKRWKGGREG